MHWKPCCLEKVAERLENLSPTDTGCVVSRYTHCLLRDAGSITMAPKPGSEALEHGLMYEQLYNSRKNQLDANGHYPFPEDDCTLEAIALNSNKVDQLKSQQHASIDKKYCYDSFNSAAQRVILACRLNDDRSWGVRRELRLSVAFMAALMKEFERRGWPKINSGMRFGHEERPFNFHPTWKINRHMEETFATFVSFFHTILGAKPDGQLTEDERTLARIAERMIKVSVGEVLLERYSMIWKEMIDILGKSTLEDIIQGDGTEDNRQSLRQCRINRVDKNGVLDENKEPEEGGPDSEGHRNFDSEDLECQKAFDDSRNSDPFEDHSSRIVQPMIQKRGTSVGIMIF